MSIKTTLQCAGWATDPNALVAGQAGALRVATNAMIRSPNVVERRPGFSNDDSFTPTTYTAIRSLQEWNNGSTNRYIVTHRASSNSYTIAYEDGTAITGVGFGSSAPQSEIYNQHSFLQMRGNMYICGTDTEGLEKLTSGTDTAVQATPGWPVLSGAQSGAAGFTTGDATYGPLADTYACAWRVVIRRKDANGYITRSAPSNYMRYYNNATGSARRLNAIVRLPLNCEANDVIEVYRSKTVSGDVDVADELYYAGEYQLVAADITRTYAQNVTETCTDLNLGAALYTNASQEGILKANSPPPSGLTTAQWGSCAWFGHAIAVPSLVLTLNRTDGAFGDTVPYFGRHTTGVTSTNIIVGSTTVTVAAGGHLDIYIGQCLTFDGIAPGAADAVFAAGTTVTDYNTTTGVITFSPAAIGLLGAGAPLYLHDTIRIGSNAGYSNYYAAGTQGTALQLHYDSTGITATAQESKEELVVRNLVNKNATRAAASNGSAGHMIYPVPNGNSGGTFIVRGDGSLSTITVAVSSVNDFTGATNPIQAITPAQSWNSGLGTAVSNGDYYHRVYYSKPDEPEACPETNYLNIGKSTARVLKLVPLRDSLLVFKEDGIWRISGSPPDDWRVDLVSEDYRLVHSRMVTVYEDLAYAWTNKGIVTVSAYGDITKIDTPIHDQVESVYLNNYDSLLVPTDTVASTMHAVTHERLGLVIFQMPDPSSETADYAGGFGGSSTPYTDKKCYCYCPATSAWFSWEVTANGTTASMFHRQSGKLYFARRGKSEVRKENLGAYQADPSAYYDEAYSVTLSATSGVTTTCAVGSTNYTIKPGDFINQSGQTYRIVSASGTTLTMDRAGLVNGAATAQEVAVVTLQWHPQVSADPSVGARWMEMAIHLDAVDTAGGSTAVDIIRTGGSGDADIVDRTSDMAFPLEQYYRPVIRAWLPKQLSRSNTLAPLVMFFTRTAYWKINGITLESQVTSEKGRRAFNG